jgi:hypothetical protein
MRLRLTREEHRSSEEVSLTLSLLTVTKPQLIRQIVSHIVNDVPATALAGNLNCAQIYRGKKKFIQLRDKVARLSESYSRLFAVQADNVDGAAFPVILNVDKADLEKGLLWKSVKNGSAYKTAELCFFTLSDDEYVPFSII